MQTMNFSSFNTRELLAAYAAIMDTLRSRKVTRSANSPLADYAEGLCARALGLKLEPNSTTGYDATDTEHHKYEIKARRLTGKRSSRQLSAIRAIELQRFDLLAGILFASDFAVIRGALIPHAVVKAHGKHIVHVNAWRFMLVDEVWHMPGVVDITDRLKTAQEADQLLEVVP